MIKHHLIFLQNLKFQLYRYHLYLPNYFQYFQVKCFGLKILLNSALSKFIQSVTHPYFSNVTVPFERESFGRGASSWYQHCPVYSYLFALSGFNHNVIFMFKHNCHFTLALAFQIITFNPSFNPFISVLIVAFSCSIVELSSSPADFTGTFHYLLGIDFNLYTFSYFFGCKTN